MADAQVLIVGAGPVGLTAALLLQSLGISFRIVEKNPQPVSESRALGIQPRTLELFEQLGLAEALLAEGLIARSMGIFLEGEEKVRIGFAQLETPYPGLLILPQSGTERLLSRHLAERGAQIERSVELTALVQDDAGATCTLRHADGREESCRVEYVLGCDGAHSTVRKQVSLGFAGEPIPGTFLLADAQVDGDWPGDEGRAYVGSAGFLLVIPIGGGQWRIIARLTTEIPPSTPAGILELLQQLCSQRGPPGFRPHDPTWLSMFQISSRIVERFRSGRVLVLGDAAHIHSPAGGQGMNTGMQEAFNLCWKLAMRLRGQASDALLDSYDLERRPHAQAILQNTERATHLMMSTGGAASWLRNAALAVAGTVDMLGEKIVGQISDLKVTYRQSPLSAEEQADLAHWLHAYVGREPHPGVQDRIDFAGGPHAGDRAPDAEGLCRTPGQTQRLFRWRGAGFDRHHALVFSGQSATNERMAQLEQIVRELNARTPQLLSATLVRCGLGKAQEHVLYDTQRTAHQRYGARYECLYLIRPDGHVGFRGQPVDSAALERYWAKAYGG
jgi:2-polyprenyl-6-methoxyphenol hydroxylase-like FAD-dependent oxidoreductase